MEEVKLIFGGLLRLKHGQVVTEFIILNEGMGHLDTLGFHGMLLTEVIVGDRAVVEVAHLPHLIFLIINYKK